MSKSNIRTAIVYSSRNKGNTRILVDAIAAGNNIDLYNARSCNHIDLSDYDLIGFASGIYYGSTDKAIMRIMEEDLPRGKKVFFVCTSGSGKNSYLEPLMEMAKGRAAGVAGAYCCRGSISVNGRSGKLKHPSAMEIRSAVNFFNEMMDRLESEREQAGAELPGEGRESEGQDRKPASMVTNFGSRKETGMLKEDLKERRGKPLSDRSRISPEDRRLNQAATVIAGAVIATPLFLLKKVIRKGR